MQTKAKTSVTKGKVVGITRVNLNDVTPTIPGTGKDFLPKKNKDIEAVLNGYPYNEFVALAEDINLPISQLSKIAGIASSTLNRRELKGKLTAPESDRLYLTRKVFDLAVEVTGSKENARIWMVTPQISLNNEKPISYLRTIPGADIVINLLYAMEYGVYL